MNQNLVARKKQIADLNVEHDPDELSHYFPNTEWHFFHGGRPVAFCGYRLKRRPDTRDVTSTIAGEHVPEDVQQCPRCAVLYEYGISLED